jgi:phenylacetate-CoA ligase
MEDLSGLPLLRKEDARQAPASLLVGGTMPRGVRTFHTSGSTGTPLATYWTPRDLQRSLALREARSAGWAGVSYLEPRATFSGRLVVPDPVSPGPFHRYNLAERQIYFSAFHLGPGTVGAYVKALRRHRPAWLTGYAYSYYTLARLMREAGLEAPGIRAVVTTSEKVTAGMRDVMQQAYGCEVFEEYATVEDVMYACQCERGSLHVSPDAGIVEILDSDGRPCPPGMPGEVVATGFVRESQIFLRFRLGDEAVWDGAACPCGREMPVIREVRGRVEDAVFGPDGREMVRFHGIFVDQPHVREGQIEQLALDRILARVVPAPGFGPADAEDVRRRIRQRLTPAVSVEVVEVAAIPRTPAGKFAAVVSSLSAEERDRVRALPRSGA